MFFSENRVYLLSLSLLGAKMSTDSVSGDRWVKFEQSNPRLYRYLPQVTVKDVGDAVKNDNFEYSERLSKFFVNKMIYLYTVVQPCGKVISKVKHFFTKSHTSVFEWLFSICCYICAYLQDALISLIILSCIWQSIFCI